MKLIWDRNLPKSMAIWIIDLSLKSNNYPFANYEKSTDILILEYK